jgi:hypothetical protein
MLDQQRKQLDILEQQSAQFMIVQQLSMLKIPTSDMFKL